MGDSCLMFLNLKIKLTDVPLCIPWKETHEGGHASERRRAWIKKKSDGRYEDSPNIFNDRRIWGVLVVAVFVHRVRERTRPPRT